jgi:serine protease Do
MTHTTDRRRRWLSAFLMLALVALPAARAQAQDPLGDAAELMKETLQRVTVPRSALTNGRAVRRAFREVVERPSQSTCRVLADGKEVALGTIVAADGWIVTKASQLHGDVACRLKGGHFLDAKIVGVDEDYDLAVLKVEADHLPAIEWADPRGTHVGQWAVTPGLKRDPVAVGVVSVLPREIPHPRGILGVVLNQSDAGPAVAHVLPDSGAARAGLQVGDVIIRCDATNTRTSEALVKAVRGYAPGDEIELTVLRGGEELKFKATLTARVGGEMSNRREVQNHMGSELSDRRAGFPLALQHDTVLRPTDCGGPLVDLDGRALGVNVARAGRTESFAIPAAAVRKIVAKLKTQ